MSRAIGMMIIGAILFALSGTASGQAPERVGSQKQIPEAVGLNADIARPADVHGTFGKTPSEMALPEEIPAAEEVPGQGEGSPLQPVAAATPELDAAVAAARLSAEPAGSPRQEGEQAAPVEKTRPLIVPVDVPMESPQPQPGPAEPELSLEQVMRQETTAKPPQAGEPAAPQREKRIDPLNPPTPLPEEK